MSILMVEPIMDENGTTGNAHAPIVIDAEASSSDVADRLRDIITDTAIIQQKRIRPGLSSITLDVHQADDVPLTGAGYIKPDHWRDGVVMAIEFALQGIENVEGRRVATYSIEQLDVPPPSNHKRAGPDLERRSKSKRRQRPIL